MANKPKWLDEGTTIDLLEELAGLISQKMDKAGVTKAKKIIKELKERQPAEGEDTVGGIMEQIKALADEASELYEEEASELANTPADDDDEDEDDDDEDDDDDYDDEDDDEDYDDDEDDDEEEIDLNTMSLTELKKLAKDEYGITGTKKWKKKAVAIKAILAVAEEDEDDEADYSTWTIQELRKEAKKRGIKAGASTNRAQFAKLLEKDDKK